MHRNGEFTLPGAERHYPPDLEIEPTHLDIALAVDLGQQTADARVTVTVTARRTGPRALVLHGVAFEQLRVADVSGGKLSHAYDGREIHITWDEPFAALEERRVLVTYHLTKPVTGLFFSQPTDASPDDPWFAATDNETERARHWLACIDLPSVRCRLDFHLTAASRFTTLANGSLISETENDDGTKTAHWHLDIPCPSYLTCFAIGDLVRCDDGEHEGIPIAYFAPPPLTEEHLRRSFGRTPQMLAWLTTKLDHPLPFPKYYQFALPAIGGAMENISLVSWDQRFVMDETLAEEWTWLVDIINVHEMAHSFFGDLVVIRDFAHAWLKESWAVYMEQCWLEDTYGDDEKLYAFYSNARAYFEEADDKYKRPIVTREFNTSWDLYDRHLYPGGAARLHTLRNVLGDETFWTAVRDYVRTYVGKVVETDDLRRMLEKHSGRSLGKLFDQWFHSPGYPALKVSFAYDAARAEGTFTVEQTQKDDKAGVPLFDLSLELGYVLDGELTTVPVRVRREREVFVIPIARDPEQVRIDPHGKVLLKLDMDPGEARLKRQLTEAGDVIGRILAGTALCKGGTRSGTLAVRDAWLGEPFWGVRVELARALGEAGTDVAVEVLADLVTRETHPMVLEPLFRAAGRFRDERIAKALNARVAGKLPYRARGAAYEALGAQREAAPFELLASAAATEDFSGFAQSGALRGLAATRQTEAIPLLLEATRPGSLASDVRPAAIGALAEVGAVQEHRERERIVERVVDLLRDPAHRAREAAAAGLKTLRATEGIAALQAYRATLSAQDRVRIERILKGIRESAKPPAVAVEKQLDELREKIRKLEGVVGKLEARLQPVGNGSPKGG